MLDAFGCAAVGCIAVRCVAVDLVVVDVVVVDVVADGFVVVMLLVPPSLGLSGIPAGTL
ncbi:CBS domain protein [Streptomyces sp. NBRC 110611]|nr:CBS domain protein [Streptomyces sp. NBRC 110611]